MDANRIVVKNARFSGLADSTPEGAGTTKLVRNWFYDEKGAVAATSRGKLNDGLSFVEWSLKPGRTVSGSLVFTLPASGNGPCSAILVLLENQAPPTPVARRPAARRAPPSI